MNVLLTYPFRDDAYHKVGFVVPPMGLAYVAAALKDAGHEVTVRDFNVNRSSINYSRFDVVGISMDTSRYKAGLEIARGAKSSGCMVIAGGPHVNFLDEDALKTGLIDYVVRGEGERTAVELLEAMSSGKGVHKNVEGISFLDGGTFVRTSDRGFSDELDTLRPARELLEMDRYRSLEMGRRTITPVVTSRGCPFACSFCCSSQFAGRKWRAMSPTAVVDEIEDTIGTYNYGGIAFLDDNFSMNAERVEAICDGILERGLDIYWWCFSRADILLKHPRMVQKMGRAGCRYVFIGFESPRQDTLDAYKKGTTGEMAREVVELLRRNNISTHASFIIGAVDETREMALQTIRFAKELNPQAVQFSILTPYPGTKMFEDLKDRITTYDWDLYDCLNPVVRCDHLSASDLKKLVKKAYMSFYLSPGKILAGVMSGLRGKGIKLSSILKILKGTS